MDRWFWGTKPSLAWFRRQDHFGPADITLKQHVSQLVKNEGQPEPKEIFLLTSFRYFGFVFNPVSLYFCCDGDGQPETLVAEVTNTPWNETHSYVVPKHQWRSLNNQLAKGMQGGDGGEPSRSSTATQALAEVGTTKQFHVSPFMPMEQTYHWGVGFDPERVLVTIDVKDLKPTELSSGNQNEQGQPDQKQSEVGSGFADTSHAASPKCFNATLNLRKKGSGFWTRLYYLFRYPALTLQIMFYIYWQALWLWGKGVAFHSHPAKAKNSVEPKIVN